MRSLAYHPLRRGPFLTSKQLAAFADRWLLEPSFVGWVLLFPPLRPLRQLLIDLVYMGMQTLHRNWRSARTPPLDPGFVLVHAVGPGGGFRTGYYSHDGNWYTTDWFDDGTTEGRGEKRQIRVTEWRELEGSGAEPWHEWGERYWPPELPKAAVPTPRN